MSNNTKNGGKNAGKNGGKNEVQNGQKDSEVSRHTYFLQSIYETMSTGLLQFKWEKERYADVINMNNAAFRLSGYSKMEFKKKLNNDFVQMIHPEDRDRFVALPPNLVANGKAENIQCRLNTYDGKTISIDMRINKFVDMDGDEVCQVEFYDTTVYAERERELQKEVEASKNQVVGLKLTDTITGLANMEGFRQEGRAILEQREAGKCYAVIYSALNNFVYINDRFNIERGNELLRQYGEMISAGSGILLGSRVFSINFVEIYAAPSKKEILEMLRDRYGKFSALQRAQFPGGNIYPSTGVYILKDEDKDIDAAMDNANIARKRVMGNKGVICSVYTDDMGMEREIDREKAKEVTKALAENRIDILLQPKYNIQTKREQGAEALAVWRDEDGSSRVASEFINVLEDVGLISEVDFVIYGKVLQVMKKWKEAGMQMIPVSINFSKTHSYEDNFVERMFSMADAAGVDKHYLELEFPESAFLDAGDALGDKLQQLREAGFKINIDEYGDRGSDVRVLLDAPADRVKLSMDFVMDAFQSEEALEYLRKLCALIEYTGKDVIFLGIEAEEDDAVLVELGTSGRAQGFFFGGPLEVADFETKFVRPEKSVEGVFKIIGK